MGGDRKAEIVARHRQPRPVCAGIGGAIDAGMVLHPHHVRRRGAAGDAMRILDGAVLGLFRRHIGRNQSFTEHGPCGAVIAGLPHAAAGDGDERAVRVARVGRYAVNAGIVIAAAEPARAFRHVPQRGHELPAFAAIVGAEQAGRNGANPQSVRVMRPAAFERPDLEQRRLTWRVGGKGRRGDFAPGAAVVVGAMQFRPEVPELECCEDDTVILTQRIRHRISDEADQVRRPAGTLARQREQTFPCRHQQSVTHIFEFSCSLRSTARQRLHDIKLGVGADAARQRTVVREPLAVGKDADVLAEPALVVEHIAAHMRPPGDEIVQRFADGHAGRRQRAVGHEVAQVTGEMDFGHRRILSRKCGNHPPSAASIAANAASAFDASGPPACAISGRPPPPLPPSASAPLRTKSTALKRLTRSSVTPTTMPALPSSVTPTMATTPEPTFFLPSSARLRRSFRSMPSTERAISFTSPTVRTPSAPSLMPPPMASFFLASESSRSRRLRSSSSATTRFCMSSIGTRNSEPVALAKRARLFKLARAVFAVSASIRRTPPATPLSPTTEIRPISPVRLTWVPPHSSTDQPMVLPPPSPMATTRTSSPYFSPNRARAPEARASSSAITRVTTGAFCSTNSLAMSSTRSISSALIGFGWEKSKRSRSGATSEPFCAT